MVFDLWVELNPLAGALSMFYSIMKLFTFIVSSVLVLILAIILGFRLLNSSIEYPVMEDEWWGASHADGATPGKAVVVEAMDTIRYPVEEIEDLNHRLTNTRYFQSLEGTHWEYGTNIEDLRAIVQYWLEEYNWRNQEAMLNTLDHFTATIDGIKVHYVHVKPKTKATKIIPILLIHGWPGSFYEFYKLIPLLTSQNSESEFSFEVICPSLPGYIFSEAPHKPGLHPLQISKMFTKLMAALGFKSYYVQGGDWGSLVARTMGVIDSSHVKGVHLNMFIASPPYGPFSLMSAYAFDAWNSGADHRSLFYPLKDFLSKIMRETGYFHLHATKPDSIGVALNDSPVGLAAYIIEKFFTWSGCKRNDSITCLESHFTKDELLTNVMLYWLTRSMPSAMRLYKENRFDRSTAYPLSIPTALADFPNDLLPASPYSWLEVLYPNIVQYTKMPRGGHFAALEEPQLLANDIWKFVTKVELISIHDP